MIHSGNNRFGTLYIVATPIGNLEDITLRALRILKEVNLIAAEDTRHSQKLLNHFGIHTRLISYYRENETERAHDLILRLQDGESIALISDAGTPGISDPGAILVRLARQTGIPLVPIPGPSALTTALSGAGLAESTFLFLGFLPSQKGQRQKLLASLVDSEHPLVMYESPNRMEGLLTDALAIFGEREAFWGRELTKTYEELQAGKLSELLALAGSRRNKGESVVIVCPGVKNQAQGTNLEELLVWYRDHSGMSLKDACRKLASDLGLSRSQIYQQALAIWQNESNMQELPTPQHLFYDDTPMKHLRTCVTPEGVFRYGIHKPSYTVTNLRQNSRIQELGRDEEGCPVDNTTNFPPDDVAVTGADWIFEIPNPLPFKGTTYIDKEWADASAAHPGRICITPPPEVTLIQTLNEAGVETGLLERLPEPLLLALATTSTDPADLARLAEISCDMEHNSDGRPIGLGYTRRSEGRLRPIIHNHLLFEAVANNPHLPDAYKIVMVLRPGAQGGSEIVGEWPADGRSHVFEYLRRNSYIAGGHYAANMADDAIRYSVGQLSFDDMRALRHLYYQRTYARLATDLGLSLPGQKRIWVPTELEALRLEIGDALKDREPTHSATLWGWNFGFDYAPSRYRLHASHQQIHQQYAMIPEIVEAYSGDPTNPIGIQLAFGCGDMIAEIIEQYADIYQRDFFSDYQTAIVGNRRMDGRDDLESSLLVWSDANAMLFVPKAQTSQWEMQLMTKKEVTGGIVGNIVEADTVVRESLDTGIFMAQKALAGLGAKMVTSIEYPKRFGKKKDATQPLLYAFLPRLPESPGAFSEAQLRYINGHYPEDFAAACRRQLS